MHIELINYQVAQSKFTVVYIRASWCWVCDLMTPVFNAAAANEESLGQITFCTIDASTPSEGSQVSRYL